MTEESRRVWFAGNVRVSNQPHFRATEASKQHGYAVNHCPECQAILFVGKLEGEIKCPHCRVFVAYGPT